MRINRNNENKSLQGLKYENKD